MVYIGFNLDDKDIEKLKVISFITDKNRTALLKEGIEYIISKYSDSFDKFREYVKSIEK
jgi:hypothetical protein